MSGSVASLFQRLTQGVYLVGVSHGDRRNAFTAAWVMQVSFDPLLLALSINPRHSSYALLKEGSAFGINVLKKSQLGLAEGYGRPANADKKLTSTEWSTGRSGLPLLREALAWFESEVVREHPAGDVKSSTHMKTCPDCNGDGVVDKDTDDERQCPTCGGLDFAPDDDEDHEEVIKTSRDLAHSVGSKP